MLFRSAQSIGEPEGLGFTDGLSPDADDTAAVLGALQALGRRPSLGPLRRFVTSTHVVTYPGELQPSAITTARAIQVLHTAGEDVTHLRQWLAARQEGDGRWPADKWNSNWIYTTWQVILALREDPFFEDVLQHVCRILIAFQYRDGGWGISHSTIEATAYGLLALAALPRSLRLPEVDEAIRRAVDDPDGEVDLAADLREGEVSEQKLERDIRVLPEEFPQAGEDA